MITVEKIDEKIIVKFPYNIDYIEKIKTIEGYRWDIQKKYWYFPDDDGIAEKILRSCERNRCYEHLISGY